MDVPLPALRALVADARGLAERHHGALARVTPAYRDSAENFLHYLALRRRDLRPLQQALHELGLSSLGRCEAAVLASLYAVERAGAALAEAPEPALPAPSVSFARGRALLDAHADGLLGPAPPDRQTRVMVTLNREDITVDRLVTLLEAGMGVLRLNLAKGTEADWVGIADDLDEARRRTGRGCRLYCDLAGPNPRTVCPPGKGRRLRVGDRLTLGPRAGDGAIGVTLPEVLPAVRVGHRVFFDDGRLAAVAVARGDGGAVTLEVTRARKGKARLGDHKGINLPDSDLPLPSLTDEDREALDFVVTRADMVGLSFVREPDDVESLIAALEACGRPDLGMVLKIETVPAFRNFPALLLTAMTRPGPVGVMVARGDMGVELGFERTSEVQEELLWLCEAAHTPLIWATQVLESLTKKGLPTRAEITDAAKGARAECVMLNRGARVEDALTMLVDILGRMEQHQQKKLQLFRELSVSRGIDLP